MRKVLLIFMMIFVSVSLIACSSDKESDKKEKGEKETVATKKEDKKEEVTKNNPSMEGYVIEKTEKTILVVSNFSRDFSATGGVKEHFDSMHLTGDVGEVEVGQYVKVWIEGPVRESFPVQADLKKIEIIEPEKEEKSDLKAFEAIAKAIKQKKEETSNPIVIFHSEYDEKEDVWNVILKAVGDERDTQMKIEDKKAE